MDLAGPSLPLVFAAGVVSFLSPCVLPLVPAYLSTISGVSFDPAETRPTGSSRRVVAASVLFFAGFLTVFIALGASASQLGALLADHRLWLARVAGATIIVFGLAMIGVGWSGAIGAGAAERIQATARRRGGPAALGVAFAFCWTPCIGPVLGSILTLAGASTSLRSGVLLLVVYGTGLAVPFLLVGLGVTRTLTAIRAVQRHYRAIQRVAGALLIGMGVLLVTNRLYLVNAEAQRLLTSLGMDWWTRL